MKFLVDAVGDDLFHDNKFAEWFEEWLMKQGEGDADEALATATDINTHGVDAGYPDLSYYTETTTLYADYKADIWEILEHASDEEGVSIYAILERRGDVVDADTFENNMVWAAVETLAALIVQLAEAGETDEE